MYSTNTRRHPGSLPWKGVLDRDLFGPHTGILLYEPTLAPDRGLAQIRSPRHGNTEALNIAPLVVHLSR